MARHETTTGTADALTSVAPVLLPEDRETVEVRLIQTLFGATPSILLGASIGILSAGFVAWHYWNPLTSVICTAMVFASVLRFLVHVGYEKDAHRELNARAWERRFAWAAWCFSACLGATGVVGLVGTDNMHVHLFLIVTITGLVSTMACRNAGRLKIVGPQVALILIPIGIAFALRADMVYYALAGITIFHIFSLSSLARTWRDRFAESFSNEIATRRISDIAHEKNELFHTALDNMKRGFAIVSADGGFVEPNNRIFELLGVDRSAMAPGSGISELAELAREAGTLDADAAGRIVLAFDTRLPTDRSVKVETLDGDFLEFHREPGEDGRSTFSIEDVTLEWKAQLEIERRATRDELTGLWNRSRTLEHLETVSDTLRRGNPGGAILFIDLDGFKTINDLFGHSTGDDTLRRAAEIIGESVRPIDHVGRMGGDEFLVFVPGATTRDDIAPIARRLLDRLCEPLVMEGRSMRIGATIGISFLLPGGASVKEAVQNADMALYVRKMKRNLDPVVFFETSMRELTNSKKCLEQDLRSTLERGGDHLAVYYQPIFDTATRRTVGCEALVRWMHPSIPKMSPDRFIPIAEESALIVDLGEWVLRTACDEAASWRNGLPVSVNLSSVQFAVGDIVETVRSALQRSGLEPSRLELEFTESVMAGDKDRVKIQIAALKALGVRIALDDFGTGYSSLKYIHEFQFDKIKIDKAFVQDITVNPMSAGIVRAVMEIAGVNGQTVVAEGIENPEELDALRRMGVQLGQGWLVGAAMPAADFRTRHVDAVPQTLKLAG